MRKSFYNLRMILMLCLASLLVVGCASHKTPDGAADARNRLTELESQPQLASRAPVAIDEARSAVEKAEKPGKDKAVSDHLVLIAQRKVDIAWAQAQTRYLEDQRKELSEQQNKERLDSRTREVDALRAEVEAAKRQLTELNAKATDRGMVVTLGDMLFETGKAELKGHAANNLVKLSTFLKENPDRSLVIEGHTDNVGSEDFNLGLSQRRAEAVRSYLLNQGIEATRLTAVGKGESTPIASNDSSSGRQMNRRVEVIISNPSQAQR